MKRSFVFTLCLLTAGLMFAPVAHAAVDAFIWFDNIKGESMDPQHQGWIELESYNFSAPAPAPPAAPAPAGVARRGPGSFSVVKRTDKASPLLSQAAIKGTLVPAIVVEVRKGSQYYRYELKNVMVSSFRTAGGGAGGAVPTEQVTLNFGAIELKYEEQKSSPKAAPPPASYKLSGDSKSVQPAQGAAQAPALKR